MDETPEAATAETTAPTPAPEQTTPPVDATPVAETPLQAVEEHAAELAKEVEALAQPTQAAETSTAPAASVDKVQIVYRTDGYETLPRHEEGLYWFHGSIHAVAPEVAERLLALTGFSRRGKV